MIKNYNTAKQRVFLALPLSESFSLELEQALKIERGRLRLRWLPKESWHLTLLPPQSWTETEAQQAIRSLTEKLRFKPFLLESERLVLAPPQREKRMLWLTFRFAAEFFRLQKEIINILLSAGFKLELNLHQEKILHLTLARFEPAKTGSFIFKEREFRQSFLAERLEFWQSFLKPTGAEYQSLAKIYFYDIVGH